MSEATGADHKRQSQELNIFHDVAKALTSSLDLDSILQTIMEKMAEYFRPDTWSLLCQTHRRSHPVGDPLHHLRPLELQAPRAGRHSAGERRHEGLRRTGNLLPAGPMRLRGNRHREFPGCRENSGT